MTRKTLLLSAALTGAIMLSVPHARAAESLGGKAVPGVCMLSRQAVINRSSIGKSARARLRQLATEGRAKIRADDKALQADVKAFRSGKASMTPAERNKREHAIQQRLQAIRQRAAVLGHRLRLTRFKATRSILKNAQPILVDVYRQHTCGLLLDRDKVIGGNLRYDLTSAVIRALDKKVTTMHFNLADLPRRTSR